MSEVHPTPRSNGVDLNRDFPDVLASLDGPLAAEGREQAETRAVMGWTEGTRFVGSASLHEVRSRLRRGPSVVGEPDHAARFVDRG